MAVERTLSIIKPDAVERNLIGKIIAKFEEKGLIIAAARMAHLTKEEAETFYGVHRERPFFGSLIAYITSGPVMLMVLEGEDAVRMNRQIMGATNPAEADEGTIRKLYANNIEENSVHGSDSLETAKEEINFFFEKTLPRTR
jgi:nucleoside-diphosphate kinase